MKYGAHLKQYEAIQRRGREVKALENIPEPLEYYFIFWSIFLDLHRARNAGFAPNPILVSEILIYCEFRGLDKVETEFCIKLIQSLDSHFFKWFSKQSKKAK